MWEAAMSAAHYHLDNIIAVVDYNKVMAKGFTWNLMSIEPYAEKWRAFGWEVIEVDGHDIPAIADAFHRAHWVSPHGAPVVVIAHTVKGAASKWPSSITSGIPRPPTRQPRIRSFGSYPKPMEDRKKATVA